MISGPLVGKFLQSIVIMTNAKRIVEVGTFTGYSAIKMAEGNPNCEIHTCELMDKHVKTAKKFIKKAKLKKNITVHKGSALDTLEIFKINYTQLKKQNAPFLDIDDIMPTLKNGFKKDGIIYLKKSSIKNYSKME